MLCTKNFSAGKRRGGGRVGTVQATRGEMSMTIRVRNRKMPIRRITDRNDRKYCGAVAGDRRPLKEFEHCV